MEFNQSAAQIAIEHMTDAVALFVEHLGFEEVMRMDGTMTAGDFTMSVLRAPGTNVDVQLTGMAPIAPQGRKHLSQFGFVSDDAEGDRHAATTIDAAHQAAETAANLVVGPGGPDYGDRAGDGTVGGDSDFGVLMGLDGEPVGLADALADDACIEADVLGGSWDDPAARWAELDTAIATWSEDGDTISQLASRPMRIAGWSSLALTTDDLDEAVAFAAVAQDDLDASLAALDC